MRSYFVSRAYHYLQAVHSVIRSPAHSPAFLVNVNPHEKLYDPLQPEEAASNLR